MNDEEGLEDTLIDAEVLSQHFGDVADATDVLETCIVERTISVAKLKWFIRRWSININKENLKPYSKNQGILEMACVYGTLPIVKCLLEDIGASVDGVSLVCLLSVIIILMKISNNLYLSSVLLLP